MLLLGSLPDVKKHDHINPCLAQLHWLPVKFRITFKILLLAYKALNHTGPEYLSNLLSCYVPACKLRSSDSGLLDIPKQKRTTLRERSFSFMALTLWNSLPALVLVALTVAHVKSTLKTHLFSLAFNAL
ncbi:UNVERIFIED_CONTAM: hypothetical protein FKN15_064701 [Acipenser sinensis]